MTEPVRVWSIFVDEADLSFDAPLYEAIVKRLRDLGVQALAQEGLMRPLRAELLLGGEAL